MTIYNIVNNIKKVYPEMDSNIVEHIIREEIDYEGELLLDNYKLGFKTIAWHIDDFEHQALTIENNGVKLFDRTKFNDALDTMIDKHDANIGINWDVIAYYLYEHCGLDELED